MIKFWFAFIFCLSPVILSGAKADTRTLNADLSAQNKDAPYRMLPCTKLYCISVDAHLFYRDITGNAGYYHGGYWLDNFFEVTPTENLSLNAKIAIYNPAASYGVVATTYVLPFIGVGWKDNLSNYGFSDTKVNIRYFDLDRQTIAAGLTLFEKEMSGLMLELERDNWKFKFIFDGTGGFDVDGDFFSGQINFLHDWLGFAAFVDTGHAIDKRTRYLPNQSPFYSVYSTHSLFNDWEYRSEASIRNQGGAGMFKVQWNPSDANSGLKVTLNSQIRYYGAHFAEGIKNHIQHDYVSIEQEDKPFTDSMNIFSIDDNV